MYRLQTGSSSIGGRPWPARARSADTGSRRRAAWTSGGELEDATLDPVDTELRDPEDDYGWWTLAGGTYLLEYNETLEADAPLRLQPRRELRGRGASHPSVTAPSLDPVPLTVADGGVQIEENARVSTLLDTD